MPSIASTTTPVSTAKRRPEILAPAGQWESLRVALACGANAVYFGVQEGFNARARAANFQREELKDIAAEAHRAGARAYLTLNTLIFEGEIKPLATLIEEAARAGIDALIVQDPATCLLAREICPELELHSSTQMTISSAESARFAESLGVKRVVLPRELSVDEIAHVAARTPLELEVFVHGALCMSWSGQCLTSEAWGGRSANRGQCAQSCRMPYDLIVDGEAVPTGDLRYLLSPLDLAAHRALPRLVDIGVRSLKIEGRLKGPAYVETAVRALSQWLDRIVADEHDEEPARKELATNLRDATLVYSRGLSDGFFGGSDHQRLVPGRFPRSRGYLLGVVREVSGHDVTIETTEESSYGTKASLHSARTNSAIKTFGKEDRGRKSSLMTIDEQSTEEDAPPLAFPDVKAGMGVAFDKGEPENQNEEGGPIFAVRQRDEQHITLTFGTPGPRLSNVKPGQLVWLTSDPALQRKADQLASQPLTGRLPLKLSVRGAAGEALVARFASGEHEVCVESTHTLSVADSRGLDAQVLETKLGAVGGTPFKLTELDSSGLQAGLHLPVSMLKKMRREAVARLETLLATPRRDTAPAALALKRVGAPAVDASRPDASAQPELKVLVRTPEQLEAVIAAGIEAVELDWMEMVGLGKAVDRARAAGLHITLATTRVQKPGEEGFDRRLDRLEPDAVLVRHWAAMMHFADTHNEGRELPLHGDFSLNVTNSLSAQHLLAQGLQTITASHDLNAEQLFAMLRSGIDPRRVVVTLHHHISTFHTEHCVYAATLSTGRDYRTCGRPCESHRVALRDHLGNDHPVIVDVGCRNTVFNAQAQSAAPLVPALIEAGVGAFRVEFVWESAEEVTRTLRAYQALLAGEYTPDQVRKTLRVHEQFGVTLGTMQHA